MITSLITIRYDKDLATMVRVIREFLKIPETVFTTQVFLGIFYRFVYLFQFCRKSWTSAGCSMSMPTNCLSPPHPHRWKPPSGHNWKVMKRETKTVVACFRHCFFIIDVSGFVRKHLSSRALVHQQCKQTFRRRFQVRCASFVEHLIIFNFWWSLNVWWAGWWSVPRWTSRRVSTSASTTATPCGAPATGRFTSVRIVFKYSCDADHYPIMVKLYWTTIINSNPP